jgi:membrane-bound lytic murein transglycosylase D
MLLNRFIVLLMMSSLLMTSCSTTHRQTREHGHDAPLLPGMSAKADPNEAPLPETPPISDRTNQPVPAEAVSGEMLVIDDSDKEDDDGTHEVLDDSEAPIKTAPNPRKKGIPFEFNQKVADWIQYFSQKDRERFQRFLDRGEPYREVIENILEENQVPADLYYLGMIESGFSTHAKSHAKAVGVWQFMRSTGKMYGLANDGYIDQRRDPIRATEAAAKMLRDLYRDFHSWPLAMAAYNAGPGRIRGAIRRGKTNDFWELVEKKKLPRETMDYVPKFLAARYIGENPELFAFYINEEKKYPNVELVKVPSAVPFEQIEKSCSMPEGTLEFVNPHYLKPFTHPGAKLDEIWVPEQYQKAVEEKSESFAAYKVKVKPEVIPVTRAERGIVSVQVVKRGDTLKSIARKQGLSVAYLKRVNGLKSDKVVPGQRLKLAASSYHQKRTHPRKHKKKRTR